MSNNFTWSDAPSLGLEMDRCAVCFHRYGWCCCPECPECGATGNPQCYELHGLLKPISFQARVKPWLLECFGAVIARDKEERNHRFLEEALELVQACGTTQSEAHQLVDYVYNRPSGEKAQEVGGVMVTLAALCLANEIDMHEAGETELVRVLGKIVEIRMKQAAKPKHSPLPE